MNSRLFLPLLILCALPLSAVADDAAVLKIFETRCADCHREDETPILHAGINLFSLRATEGEPESILDRVTRADGVKGRMPKSTGKPGDPGHVAPLTTEEIAALTAWAQGDSKPTVAGAPPEASSAPAAMPAPAPRPFVPLREEIRLIAADVAGLDPALRPFSRYLTLTNLANGTDTAEPQLETYRAALSKLLNSLSRGAKIVVPVAVDPGRTIYRLDLRDYGWTAGDWEEHLVKGYPYGLRGIDGRAEKDIADATRSASAWVRGDWFAFAAAQEPLYHRLLHLPETEAELEKQFGVDTLGNLRAGQALRAGFRLSGVSQGNRLIERHEGTGGMYWKSYDFTPLVRTGGHDLFRSPLGPVGAGLTGNPDREFVHDGGEIIFRLPNGLHGYYLSTSDGTRLNRGPTEIVQDRNRRDGAILNGISCMKCHAAGMVYARQEPLEKFVDEVGPVALAAGLDREETHAVKDLYADASRLQAAVKADEEAYLAVVKAAMPGYHEELDPVSRLYNRFRDEIRLESLAAEFGEEDASFLDRLRESRDADLESLVSQFEAGLGFPRASWLDQFKSIAAALGYHLMDFAPVSYAEFTRDAPQAGGNEGQVALAEGGQLRIATDQPSYRFGELLTVKVKATEGVYLRLYHLSATKEVQQIFPNEARPDNFIRGGEEIVLGTKRDGDLAPDEFRFRMKEPAGTEIILAVASPVQFTDRENLTFGRGEGFKGFAGEHDLRQARGRGTKGLEVETRDAAGTVTGRRAAPVFEARAVYTVAP